MDVCKSGAYVRLSHAFSFWLVRGVLAIWYSQHVFQRIGFWYIVGGVH